MKILSKLSKKKKILIVAAILLLGIGGYFIYQKTHASVGVNKYVISAVEKGSIINSIAGSGQISTSDQIAIQPKASGSITSINVKVDQQVKKGDVIATIDSKDAQKTVRDAASSLQSSQLSLQKFQEAASASSITQAQNAIDNAKTSLEKLKTSQTSDYETATQNKQNSEDNLVKAYDDGFSSIANAFLDLPNVMSGLNGVLLGYDFSGNQANVDYYSDAVQSYNSNVTIYRNDAYNKYQTAKTAYDKNFADYKAASRSSDTATIDSLINETYNTTKSIADAVKSTYDLIQFYQDQLIQRNLKVSNISNTHISNLNSYTSTTNNHLNDLLSAQNTIKSDNQTINNATKSLAQMDKNNPLDIASAEASIKEKEDALANLTAAPDALDLQSQQLSVQQKQNSLYDAEEKLADYTVKAPVDGIIAAVSSKVNDSASTSTSIATLISKQKIAEVSLGETDIINVKVGQKATFTFDAIDGLSLTGEVAEVGDLGTATQGVVSYTVKIILDTDDDRVKSGMSFSVNIITDSKTDVLVVPTSAIKASGSGSYIEIPNETIADDQLDVSAGIVLNNKTKQQTVVTGLTDGTNTEITSGLVEGDKIITKTIKPTTTTSSSTSSSTNRSTTQSLIGGGGAFGGGAAGAVRAPTTGAARGN